MHLFFMTGKESRSRVVEDMKCPACGYFDSKVVDSRPTQDGGSIRRRKMLQRAHAEFSQVKDDILYFDKED